MLQMKRNKDHSEILSYDEIGIPVYIREGYLSSYPNYHALCHWHEDIEFILVLDGCMEYYINGKNIHLEKGNVVMVNSKRLHYGYSNSKNECHFYCIIFHPSFLSTNKKISQKYISPITQNNCSDYLLFTEKDQIETPAIIKLLQSIYQVKTDPSASYELDMIGLLLLLWKKIYHLLIKTISKDNVTDLELISQQKMVSYIYQNYSEPLSLRDIAAAGNVCRSKCCQIFQKYVGQSPLQFANCYRLEKSRYLLQTTSLSVTEITMTCGFNHLSYFAKQFKKKYGKTPGEYRKMELP